MGQTEGGTKVRKVFWASFQHVDKSDIGGPGFPVNLQHSSGRSGKGGTSGSLRNPGGGTWVQMVGG